jgi:hypothetical protein
MAIFNIPGVTTPKTTVKPATTGFSFVQPTAPKPMATPAAVKPVAAPAVAAPKPILAASKPTASAQNPYLQPAAQPPGVQPLTTASMNTPQKEALEALTRGTGPVNPNIAGYLDKAGSAVDRMATPYDYSSYQQFMNPYIDEVINRNAANIGRNYDIQRNRINEDFAAANGFGSSAQGTERALTNEAQMRQIGDMDAQLRAQGFDTATGRSLDLYGTGLNAAQSQAGQFQNIASGYQGADAYAKQKMVSDLQNKLTAGGQIQDQNQRELDAYFAERDRAFAYPYVNSDYLANILRSYPTGQTSTTVQPGVGALQGALGGGLLGSAIAGNSNSYLQPSSYGTYSTQGALPWQQPGANYPIYK